MRGLAPQAWVRLLNSWHTRGLAPQGRSRSGFGVKQLIKERVGSTMKAQAWVMLLRSWYKRLSASLGMNRPRLGCYPADILEGWIVDTQGRTRVRVKLLPSWYMRALLQQLERLSPVTREGRGDTWLTFPSSPLPSSPPPPLPTPPSLPPVSRSAPLVG